MATQWLGQDGYKNAGNSEVLTSNTPKELSLSCDDMEGMKMDTQSCMDQTIVAIFEDSSVSLEDKCGAEEDSESLLSALTEMLESVEDDDGILSPFDSLPDTKLLASPERRENKADSSIAERLRPRSKQPNVKFTIKIDGEKKNGTKVEEKKRYKFFKQQSKTLFDSNKGKTQSELEVFTSTSLVNLVKIMHPYCLKLHVEEEENKLGRRHTFFSQEEVWKFEKPTDDIDEEINVVSDDEVTVNETKLREEGVEQNDNGKLLKSALTSSRGPSMEKKRVSFGPLQVASFDTSMEMGLNEKKLTCAHMSENVLGPVNFTKANPVDAAQEMSSEDISNHAEDLLRNGERKSKSISLQQYRKLCLQRQPLAEKPENYATKWPSVSEPPKELTPIFGLQEQRQKGCGTETACGYSDCRRSGADYLNSSQTSGYTTHGTAVLPRPQPSQAKPFPSVCVSRLKRQRSECNIISHDNPLPGITTRVLESKKSAVKKPIAQSSDPPNPVLVPIPICRTKSPQTDHSSSVSKEEFLNSDYNLDNTRHFQEIQNKSSNTFPQQYSSSLGPNAEMSTVNWESTPHSQENKIISPKTTSDSSSRSPAICPPITQIKPLDYMEVQSQNNSLNLTRETKPEPNTPLSTSQLNAAIPVKETSLEILPNKSLSEEQLPTHHFGCGVQNGTADSGIEAPDLTSLLEQFEETQAKDEWMEPPIEHLKTSCTLGSPEKDKIPRNLLNLQTSDDFNIPEPLGPEIIFCTRHDLQARRKNPPSKGIQIIKPRPLPSKKTHCHLPDIQGALTLRHLYSLVSSDHDYCRPVDRLELKDIYKTSHELQRKNKIGDAAECQQTSTGDDDTTIIRAIKPEKSTMQPFPEEPRTQSEKSPSTDSSLAVSDTDKPAPCTLPTPPPSPCTRGNDRRMYRRRSPYSDSSPCSSSSSSSSSGSRSPKRKKRRNKGSERSSCSSSPSLSISRSPPSQYRWSYSRSRSWSKSRSRSPAPETCSRRWRRVYSSRESMRLRREEEIRIQKLKAIEDRRVVYVGCICRSMTHDELKERFSQFGEVECVSLHFRDRGDHYGFVTFHNKKDAFEAIDNGSKLWRPDELPFDLCFGGRRQFCNSDYTDLDANRDVDPSPTMSKFEGLDFDQLLKQAQRGLKR